MSVLEVRGLRVLGTHGVLPAEKQHAQPFEVDLDLHFDMAAAAMSDDLNDTVDYGGVVESVVAMIQGPSVELLERLATLIADGVLAFDARITSVEVALRKLEPPVPYEIATAGVRVTVAK